MKIMKVRKNHECGLCHKVIEKGSHCLGWTLLPNKFDNDSFVNVRVHKCCFELYNLTNPCIHDPYPSDNCEWRDSIQGFEYKECDHA